MTHWIRNPLTVTLVLLLAASGTYAAIPASERDALIALYNATNGPGWSDSTNWLGPVGSECTWKGVSCGGDEVSGLSLDENQLSGPIPSELGNLTNLVNLSLFSNQLTGSIPPELGNLTQLRTVDLASNKLSGSIPSELENLSKLATLDFGPNQLTGAIPVELGNLTDLGWVDLGSNQLTGVIPVELANLTKLATLVLAENQLTGAIPVGLGALTGLRFIHLGSNQLSGPIPRDFGNLTNLQMLILYRNQLTGPIPPELGNLTNLQFLWLYENRLGGPIPPEIGNLTKLEELRLEKNALVGELPSSLQNLTSLVSGNSDFAYNGLYTVEASLRAILNLAQSGGDFESTQTVAPTDVEVRSTTAVGATLQWTPVTYSDGIGSYRVRVATSPSGPFIVSTVTSSKTATSASLKGLMPSTTYYFQVDTLTSASGDQQNDVVSDPSKVVSGMTAISQPEVVVTRFPGVMTAAADGVSTDTTSFSIVNLGQTATNVSFAQTGLFFSLSDATMMLGGGASARIVVSSLPQSSVGDQRGSISLSGVGVPSNSSVNVILFASPPRPEGDPLVVVETRRVDVKGPAGVNPTGVVTFRNVGDAPATGILGSDQPWLVPEGSVTTIETGATRTLSFAIDRSRRPDADALSGTQTGTLAFIYLAGASYGSASRNPLDGEPTLAAPAAIGDTVKPEVEAVLGIPLLQDGEIGLVIPGIGNVTGSVGVFITDLAIANGLSGLTIDDLALYYISGGATLQASQSVKPGHSLALADVVATVFDRTEQIGALHVRSSKALELAINANVFNKSNPEGTYGTAIPVFRSDRSAGRGEMLVITGMRKSETSHTNLYLQEALGSATNVLVEFLGAGGSVIGTLSDQPVSAFGTTIIGQHLVPEGAVTARVTNLTAGGIVAHATPVDRESGDTWVVADWNRMYGFEGDERQLVPVAGSAPGRNNTYFRTDVAVVSRGSASNATIRYHQQSPTVFMVERKVSLGPYETLTFDDVVAGLFESTPPSVGHLELMPPEGASLSMTSRTYTTVEGSSQTFGTGVPTLPSAFALRSGQSVVMGGLEDSTAATTNAATPATFRTNLGLVEVEGAAARLRVSVLLFDGKDLAAGEETASTTVDLAPREFKQINAIASSILGSEAREADFGDLRNVQVRVDVIDGDGAVIVYATQTDNGTGDTVLRLQ